MWMDVDVALAEVPVNLFPLLDDTDFKTRETAVAYNASGMDLVWNFVTTGGAYTQTAVTPTTAGTYDWTHQGDGMYSIEIPASGGASINNDTEGFGWFSGVATGVLPWRGPVIGFRRAALNDLLIDGGTASTNLEDFFDGTGYVGGTAKLTVDATKWNGLTTVALPLAPTVAGRTLDVSAGGEAGVDWANVGTPGSTVGLSATTVATLTNAPSDSSGVTTLLSRLSAARAGYLDNLSAGAVATAAKLLSYFQSALRKDVTVDSDIGGNYDDSTDSQEAIRDRGDAAYLTATGFSTHSAADTWAAGTRTLTAGTNIALAKGTGVTGFNDLSAAQVNAEADAALFDVGLTTTVTGRVDAAVSTRLASASYTAPLDAAGTRTALGMASADLDTQLDALLAKWTTVLADSVASDGTRPTPEQAMLMLTRFLFERAVSGTALSVKKEDGSTASMGFTLNDATSPTSITRSS